MTTFEITSPDGRRFQVDGPEGSTKEQALEKVRSSLGKSADVSEPPKGPPATAGERLEATKGGVNRGIAGLAGLPVDTVENIINLGLSAYGTAKQAATGEPGPEPLHGSFGGSEYLANKAQQAGINTQNPRPDDAASRMLNTAGVIAGGSVMPGAGVGRTAAAAAGGALAGEALGPQYAGVGAMVPAAGMQAAQAAKSAVANPQTVQANVANAKLAGTAPDVAQATDSNFFRGLTNVVGRVPGGQGVIAKFREMEQEALGKTASTGVSAESGGRTIKQGITGDGGFVDRTKATWVNLDNEVAAKIPKGTTFAPNNTVKALDELTTPTPGAEKTTGALVNAKIADIKQNLSADLEANNGQLPFNALRSLRAKVGSMLDDSLVSGIPNGELKKLYGGLSKDLEGAANQAGAGQEFSRQQNYYKARMERIENTLDSVLGKGRAPEDIFKSVAPTDADSVNKIRRVMRSLEPEDRQIVSEAVVNRLGRATPGKQDTTGEKFSSETFLTNWNKINESAKSQLFPNTDVRSKLDAIAKVSSEIREGKTPFGNPSGTGQAATAAGVYGSVPVAAGMAMSGNVGGAAATLAVAGSLVAGANIGARMLTSPKVVDWLAKTPKATTPEQITAQMGRLAVIYNETKDEKLKQELADYMTSVSSK